MAKADNTNMAAAGAPFEAEWKDTAAFLRAHPDLIQNDTELLGDLNLRLRTENVVDFGPAALARLSEAQVREKQARAEIEATARSNFAAQAQAHAAVIEVLESRNNSDLARKLEEIAQLRFGLVTGVIAIEGPGSTPAGWRALAPGFTDVLLGADRLSRMGPSPHVETLFLQQAEAVRSVAMVRLAIWNPARPGVLAFGSPDAESFAPEMGAELVAFIARVIERTAERWPAL
jgi:uncharacterized protein YigA (DUF484 family)